MQPDAKGARADNSGQWRHVPDTGKARNGADPAGARGLPCCPGHSVQESATRRLAQALPPEMRRVMSIETEDPPRTRVPAMHLIAAMLEGRENVSDLICSPNRAPQIEAKGELVETPFQ